MVLVVGFPMALPWGQSSPREIILSLAPSWPSRSPTAGWPNTHTSICTSARLQCWDQQLVTRHACLIELVIRLLMVETCYYEVPSASAGNPLVWAKECMKVNVEPLGWSFKFNDSPCQQDDLALSNYINWIFWRGGDVAPAFIRSYWRITLQLTCKEWG